MVRYWRFTRFPRFPLTYGSLKNLIHSFKLSPWLIQKQVTKGAIYKHSVLSLLDRNLWAALIRYSLSQASVAQWWSPCAAVALVEHPIYVTVMTLVPLEWMKATKREKRLERWQEDISVFKLCNKQWTLSLSIATIFQTGDDDVFARVCGNWTLGVKPRTAFKQPSSLRAYLWIRVGQRNKSHIACRHRTGIVGIKIFYFDSKGFYFKKPLQGSSRLSLRFYNNFWIWCLYASCLLYCPNVPCLLSLLSVSSPPRTRAQWKTRLFTGINLTL